MQLHDVGTGDPNLERNSHGRGTQFDTPSLLGIWATAPYFHDGSASTLEDVLRMGMNIMLLPRSMKQNYRNFYRFC
jgi:cytochrome c peroxidase